ncbi:hypothetical protein ACSHWO_02695 [Streptomyces sp. HUAS TT3]|uniref:hypothetical protein n=1 Tax=Streptomyces sp. HUAS TT3 TaxID=3447510 RepID=UPI003F657F6A
MEEIAGARERFEREVATVRGCLRALAEQLTPGQVPEFAVPPEPLRDGGTVPATYHHAFIERVQADGAQPPQEAYGPGLAARAAALLSAGGWDTGGRRPGAEDREAKGVLRGGPWVRVSVPASRSSVLYEGRTSDIALYEPVPHVRPGPSATPETLWAGHELCYECDGLGWCPVCEGKGWVLGGNPGWGSRSIPRDPDRLGRCPLCSTRRVCPICNGAGQVPVGANPYDR